MYPQRSVMTCGLATALEPPHFNHAPVRGATPAPDLRIRGRVVSIHAPAWGATFRVEYLCLPHVLFQSTHPRGVRRTPPRTAYRISCFNPRTRVGCDPFELAAQPRWWICFNPRTRVGCDVRCNMAVCFASNVSIHAPAWGATRTSISCSAEGVSFNPRTRVGCDSIRSPSRSRSRSFNPRTRVGCDARTSRRCLRPCSGFQSTHPRGVRPDHHTGHRSRGRVSIHAPAWGATVSMFYPVDSRD